VIFFTRFAWTSPTPGPNEVPIFVSPPQGQARKVAMMGALDATTCELIVHTATMKRSTDFIALLEKLDGRFGSRPRRTVKPVVLVLDNWPIHTSKVITVNRR
jgi:hypothetical protein